MIQFTAYKIIESASQPDCLNESLNDFITEVLVSDTFN